MVSRDSKRLCSRTTGLAWVVFLIWGGIAEGEVWAKAKKSVAKPKEKQSPLFVGPLPALPMPTGTTLHWDTESDQAVGFTAPVTSTLEAPSPTSALTVRTVRDWRNQMRQDQARLQAIQARIVEKYERSRSFPVAERYVRGVYEAVGELIRLSRQIRNDFDGQYPLDRDGEPAPEPPVAARRVRLYVDKARGLDASVDAFLARTIQGRTESVVRIETED